MCYNVSVYFTSVLLIFRIISHARYIMGNNCKQKQKKCVACQYGIRCSLMVASCITFWNEVMEVQFLPINYLATNYFNDRRNICFRRAIESIISSIILNNIRKNLFPSFPVIKSPPLRVKNYYIPS